MDYSKAFFSKIYNVLNEMVVTDSSGTIGAELGFQRWTEWTAELKKNKKSIYFIGNGASAMMAGHMSADAFKNGGLRAFCFNEASLMTAISNDIAYEQVFAYPLAQVVNDGDILVTISSSGNSPNVVAAIKKAKELGIRVITLSGMKEGNKSRALGDLNFYIQSQSYGIVESSHQCVLHCWLDKFMDLEIN